MTMDVESIRDLVAPHVTALGLSLYDVELTGSGHARAVRVVVDRDGGVDLDLITDATRALSPTLVASGMLRDSDVLEVSSPGLERTLRRPEHFQAAIGELVSAKYTRDGETIRVRGIVASADDSSFALAPEDPAAHPAAQHPAPTMENLAVAYVDVITCRTVFEWGPAPRPGRGSKPGKGSARRPKENSRS